MSGKDSISSLFIKNIQVNVKRSISFSILTNWKNGLIDNKLGVYFF